MGSNPWSIASLNNTTYKFFVLHIAVSWLSFHWFLRKKWVYGSQIYSRVKHICKTRQ